MVVLHIIPKGTKYTVTDSKERTIYNMKKSGFGGKIQLNDASGYKLYTMSFSPKEKKPIFNVMFNDNTVFEIRCVSMFLDPGFKVVGKDTELDIISSDRRIYSIKKGDEELGKIYAPEAVAEMEAKDLAVDGDKKPEETAPASKKNDKSEPGYMLEIAPEHFDDYVPLFAACIEESFGKLNKEVQEN